MGRTIPTEEAFGLGAYASSGFARRREVLRETVAALDAAGALERMHRLAAANVERWRKTATPPLGPVIEVRKGDWGEVTATLTRTYGATFAALNMANAHVPGGGYVEGCPAQEENMFRRTDCHLAFSDEEVDPGTERYVPELTALLEAEQGCVFLDLARPRVCVRGPEDRSREDLGYAWLPDDEVFPFYELRAAAIDLRDGRAFDPEATRRRIDAQLDTLIDGDVRHVVLSAFGCGAFQNPAEQVAASYRDALRARDGAFECVAFAIFHPGYGPDNFTPFAAAFD